MGYGLQNSRWLHSYWPLQIHLGLFPILLKFFFYIESICFHKCCFFIILNLQKIYRNSVKIPFSRVYTLFSFFLIWFQWTLWFYYFYFPSEHVYTCTHTWYFSMNRLIEYFACIVHIRQYLYTTHSRLETSGPICYQTTYKGKVNFFSFPFYFIPLLHTETHAYFNRIILTE